MPADIRSFFGGKPAASQEKAPAKKAEAKSKGRKSRAVVEDSDEEEEKPAKKSTPRKAAPQKTQKAPSPVAVETTTSDYFGSNNKPKRSAPVKSRFAAEDDEKQANGTSKKPSKGKPSDSAKSTPARKTRASTNGTVKHYNEDDFDDLDNDDDIFTADFKGNGRASKDDYEENADLEDEPIVRKDLKSKGRQSKIHAKAKGDEGLALGNADVDMKDTNPDDDFLEPDADEQIIVDKPARTPSKSNVTPKKRKLEALSEDEEPKKTSKPKKAAASTKSPATKKTKKVDDEPEAPEMQAIFDSIPTIRAPTPPPKDQQSGKYNFGQHAVHTAPPAGAGSKEIPVGAENCLAGLSFVFTGVNATLGREEGISLAKRYGGKVMTAPSKKTSYVVLGAEAGPKKLQLIKDHNLKAIDEDGFFELIRRLPANGGDSKAAEQNAAKQAEQDKHIKKMAAEMEKQEKETAQAAKAAAATTSKAAAGAAAKPNGKARAGPAVEDRLWTVKYAPTQISQICGNKSQVEKLQSWLRMFPKSQRIGFKMAGKDGSGVFRAVIISGPPGIGKTTAAHLVAKMEGYDIVEMNASDTRSKKLMEEGLRGVLGTTSLLGYFAGDGKEVETSKKQLVLIMDEVDGMSAGDRGGVGALAAVCKKTSIPMILICNDRKLPKMKPFDYVTFDLPFRRPQVDQIRSRIMTIAYREGMKMPLQVVDALIEGSGKDIRQVVNMIASAKLDQEAMDFDKSKEMSKAWEKHIVLKPWDITSKILGGGMFAASNKATLNDKIELYFNDHEFSPLMFQENYLGTSPTLASSYTGKERSLKTLELVSKAADSISDGDLVDRMIHGSQQQWSLMPTHAVFSFVRPASFVAGSMAGNQTRFTAWLGKNSNQQKLTRMVKEIQGHMRLRASADRHEVRQQYVPILWRRLVDQLQREGKEAVPEIIDLMDSYFLTKDDWDYIMELGIGNMNMENVKIDSQAKATFTRLYNAQSHPLPFIKASATAPPMKKPREKPDLEEAIEESEGEEILADPVEEAKKEAAEEVDITKDKYIKAPKRRKAPAAAKGKGKKKSAAADDDDDLDDEDEEDVKPTKRAKAATSKAKGRAKK